MLLFRFYNVYVLRPHVHLCYWFSTRLSIFMPFGSIRFVFLFIWLAVTMSVYFLFCHFVFLCVCVQVQRGMQQLNFCLLISLCLFICLSGCLGLHSFAFLCLSAFDSPLFFRFIASPPITEQNFSKNLFLKRSHLRNSEKWCNVTWALSDKNCANCRCSYHQTASSSHAHTKPLCAGDYHDCS